MSRYTLPLVGPAIGMLIGRMFKIGEPFPDGAYTAWDALSLTGVVLFALLWGYYLGRADHHDTGCDR